MQQSCFSEAMGPSWEKPIKVISNQSSKADMGKINETPKNFKLVIKNILYYKEKQVGQTDSSTDNF